MPRPIVAIVGAPNVGKSTLFNRLTRRRDAIVVDIPGVTRDRHYGEGLLGGRSCIVIDTGGLQPDSDEDIYVEMARQTEQAIVEADAVVLVTDARAGLAPGDRVIAEKLRRLKDRVWIAVNKAEGMDPATAAAEFHELGLGEPAAISAAHGNGVGELIEAVLRPFPDEPEAVDDAKNPRVAIVGRPNVGKSTLVNALVGSKVTIVSRKVQTTRALIRGIVIENNAQIILVDTPGIFSPKRRLDRAMVSTAWSGAHDADLVCVLLDAREGVDEEADAILTRLATVDHEKILVLNKIDLVPREKLLALARAANERLTFARTFMVSALSGDGVGDLRHTLAEMVPPGPFHYPEDQMSDAPMRHLAAEITREKIFRQLHQELPYQSTVETDSWTERKDKSIRIEQTIFVERESQRKIVLGKRGATIKSIGAEARKEIAEIVGVPVHLFLFVKVRENWGDDPDRYREMGLEFPRE